MLLLEISYQTFIGAHIKHKKVQSKNHSTVYLYDNLQHILKHCEIKYAVK